MKDELYPKSSFDLIVELRRQHVPIVPTVLAVHYFVLVVSLLSMFERRHEFF